MAKSKSGGTRSMIRGRVGSDVYSVGRDSKGKKQQVVRSLAETVANPQTQAQMRSRMIMATIAQALAVLRPVIDHSFDNVVGSRANLNEFTARNYALIKADVAANPASDNKFGLNKWGEKGAKRGAYVVADGNAVIPAALAITKDTGVIVISLDAQDLTVGGLKTALGLSAEEYFTLIGITAGGAANYERFRINPNLSDTDQLSGVPAGNIFATEGNALATVEFSGSQITITLAAVAGCCTVIMSKKSNGKFIHSKATLGAATGIDWNAQTALPTYPVGSQDYLNGGDIFGLSESIGGVTPSSPGGGDQPVVGAILTITKQGAGTSVAKINGSEVSTGANVSGGSVVSVEITPESGKSAYATINGNAISLTLSGDKYVGTFNMPNASATLVMNSSYTSGGGGGDDEVDQD